MHELERRRPFVAGRLLFWFFLLVTGILFTGRPVSLVPFVAVWAATVLIASVAWFVAANRAERAGAIVRLGSSVVELVGLLALIQLTGGPGSILVLGLIAAILAVQDVHSPSTARALGIAATAGFVAVGSWPALTGSGSVDPGPIVGTSVFLAGTTVFGVAIQRYRTWRLARASEAIDASGQARVRAAATAGTLLEATTRFLRSDDIAGLGEAIIDALRSIHRPFKASVALRERDGTIRIVATYGFAPAEVAEIKSRLATLTPLAVAALSGNELWSDTSDADELRDRIRFFGAAASFGLPIIGSYGVVGYVSGLFDEPRDFDEPYREATRSLAAQAALAYELIAAREAVELRSGALAEQSRRLAALLDVSQRVSGLTDADEVLAVVARAVRISIGTTFAGLLRLVGPDRIVVASFDGLSDDMAAMFVDREIVFDPDGVVGQSLTRRLANVGPPSPTGSVFGQQVLDRLGITTLGFGPIVIGDHVWGAVAVATAGADEPLTEGDSDLLATLGAIAATAISRAEAVGAVARQADTLESVVAERTLQLREVADELRLANQVKSEFLTNVSHELRTPLTSILGFSDVLIRGLDGPLTADQYADMATIHSSSRHLLELIDDLIDISKIETGRLEIRRVRISPAELITAAIEAIRPLAGQKGLGLSSNSDDLPATIEADPVRLDEILRNLLSNAVKFTPSGGQVRVTGVSLGSMIAIDVTDTGVGIAANDQERVFEKFQRIAGPEHAGTGLGLSIARELAHLHGGDLELESTPGLGSRFRLTLPIGEPGRDPV